MPGYVFSQITMNCVPCENEESLLSFFNIIAFLCLLTFMLLVAHSTYTFKVNHTVRDLNDYQLYLLMKMRFCSLDDFENNRRELRTSLTNWQSRLQQVLKTYVVLFQVIYFNEIVHTFIYFIYFVDFKCSPICFAYGIPY
jgi:hypothetical protein